jgi:hypothetical protein
LLHFLPLLDLLTNIYVSHVSIVIATLSQHLRDSACAMEIYPRVPIIVS